MSIKKRTVFNVKKAVVFFCFTISLIADQVLFISVGRGSEWLFIASQNASIDEVDGEALFQVSIENVKETVLVTSAPWAENIGFGSSFSLLSCLWSKPFYYIFLFKYTPF